VTTTPASTPLNAPGAPVTDLRVGQRIHIPGHNLTGAVTSLDNDHKSTSIEIDHDQIVSVPNTTRVHLVGLTCTVETYSVAYGGIPLRLSFVPNAIREHFEDDQAFPEVEDMTDADLAEVGFEALAADRLYETFHEVLVDALQARRDTSATPSAEQPATQDQSTQEAAVIVHHACTEPLATIRVIDGDDPNSHGPYDFILTEWVSDTTALADQVTQVLRQVKTANPDEYTFDDLTAALAAADLPVAYLDLTPVVVNETF